MAQYFGIMDGAGDAWGIRVPDLPGCFGGGGSPDAARADAIAAAREWTEYRATKGFNFTRPSRAGRNPSRRHSAK